MYRIGEFSVISRVSIKMLRHYDEIDLFKPAHVDRFTGYRVYTLDQLPRLHRIMALKAMGFSLHEIRKLVGQPLSVDDLRAQAKAKHAELLDELHTTQAKLAHLQTWIRRIELENAMPDYEIILKPLTDLPPPIPPPGEVMVQQPFPGVGGLERDILLSQDAPVQADTFACTVHHGTLDDLVQAYRALDGWIQAHHYRIAGIPQEITLQSEANGQVVIEIRMPISTGENALPP